MPTLPVLLSYGGPVLWVLLIISAVAIAVFIERFLHYHRAQINSTEFLNGVRTVLKRNNVIEALSICDATPGPVARLVKVAILKRDQGREQVREALEEAGSVEVPRLEEKLNLMATIAQLAPLIGLLGTVLGFMKTFKKMYDASLTTPVYTLSGGIWQALICTAAGLAIAIPAHAAYNYLVSRTNSIVLDMERSATEIVHIVAEGAATAAGIMKFTRHVTIFRGQLDVAPFAGVFFLLVMFMMVAALIYMPGARLPLQLPRADGLSGTDKPSVAVAIDADGRLYYENQCLEEAALRRKLQGVVKKAPGPLTLIVLADRSVSYDKWLRLALLGRDVGMADTLLATLPSSAAGSSHRSSP